jgi:hypothetical protein
MKFGWYDHYNMVPESPVGCSIGYILCLYVFGDLPLLPLPSPDNFTL